MSPPDINGQPFAKIGYNTSVGLIQNDYICGGSKPDFSLDDPNMILGYTLDYLNSQKGITTNIEATTRSMMINDVFTNDYPPGYSGGGCSVTDMNTYSYNYANANRREYLFGAMSPAYPLDIQAPCVLGTDGVLTYTSTVVFAVEVPEGCVGSSPSHITGMNYWTMEINYLWLKGDYATATQMFLMAVDAWVYSPAQGPGGTLLGYFSGNFDSGTWPGTSGNCKSVRTYAYFLESARATGLWQYNSTVTNIVKDVLESMWANQNPSGSIGVSLNCNSSGGVVRDSGESDGLALLAGGDPRVPSWFSTDPVQNQPMRAGAVFGGLSDVATTLVHQTVGGADSVRLLQQPPVPLGQIPIIASDCSRSERNTVLEPTAKV